MTLPAGISISPSAANGLVGCQESGPEGIDLDSSGPGHCPDASKVGTVEVQTPAPHGTVERRQRVCRAAICGGAGQPECSEALAEEGKLFAIYLEVASRERGIHVKLKGKVELGGNGQLQP